MTRYRVSYMDRPTFYLIADDYGVVDTLAARAVACKILAISEHARHDELLVVRDDG